MIDVWVCWLRGHQPEKVVERVKLHAVTPWGEVAGIITARLECRRCGWRLRGDPGPAPAPGGPAPDPTPPARP